MSIVGATNAYLGGAQLEIPPLDVHPFVLDAARAVERLAPAPMGYDEDHAVRIPVHHLLQGTRRVVGPGG